MPKKTMSKRQTALEIIRIEYAKHGKETENRVGWNARIEAVKRGLKIYNTKNK